MDWGSIAGALAGTAVGGLLSNDHGSKDLLKAQADTARAMAEIARDNQQEYKTYYRPLERNLISRVSEYGTPQFRDRLAGEYSASVSGAYNDADRNAFESLRARGVDPTSGNAMGIQGSIGLEKAAALAGADRRATWDAEDNYFSKGAAMAGLGRGLQESSIDGLNSASAGLNSALQNANQMTAHHAYAIAPLVNAVSQGVQKYVDNKGLSWFGGGATNAPTNMDLNQRTALAGYFGYQAPRMNKGGKAAKGLARLAYGGTTHSGVVSGPGDGTVDTVPAVLADQEHVVNKEGVGIVGREFLDAVNMLGLMKRYKREQKEAAR